MEGLLDFPFKIHGLLVKNFDPVSIDLVVGLELIFSWDGCGVGRY